MANMMVSPWRAPMRPRGGVVTAITNDVRFDVFRVFLCSLRVGRSARVLQTAVGHRAHSKRRIWGCEIVTTSAARAATRDTSVHRARGRLGEPRDVARAPPLRATGRVPLGAGAFARGPPPRRRRRSRGSICFALRPPMKASARVPVLAFAAAFLVSFNVFSNYHDGLLPHVRREDPLTASTASALSILDADASAERAIHDKATAKAAAFHAHYTAGGTPTRDDHQRELDYTKHRTADRESSSSTSSTTSSSSSSADEREGDSSSTSSSSSTSPSTSSSMDPRAFRPIEHAEYAGDVVKWGSNFLLDSAEACHDACVSHADESPGCNIWCTARTRPGCGNNQPHRRVGSNARLVRITPSVRRRRRTRGRPARWPCRRTLPARRARTSVFTSS